ACEPFRLCDTGELILFVRECGEFEDGGERLLLKVRKIRRGESDRSRKGPRNSFENHDQAIRIGVWQRPEQNRIHYRKDSDAAADSQRQCRNRYRGKSRALVETPQTIANILPDRFHHGLRSLGEEFNGAIRMKRHLWMHTCPLLITQQAQHSYIHFIVSLRLRVSRQTPRLPRELKGGDRFTADP